MAIDLSNEGSERLKLIASSDETNFDKLVELASLDPKLDFQDQDLSRLDFGSADLRGYSFRNANLSFSLLRNCIVDATTDFTGANLSGAELPPEYDTEQRHLFIVFIDIAAEFRTQIEALVSFSNISTEFHHFSNDQYETAIPSLFDQMQAEFKKRNANICIVIIDKANLTFSTLVSVLRDQSRIACYYVSLTLLDHIMHGPFRRDGLMARIVDLPECAKSPQEIANVINRISFHR